MRPLVKAGVVVSLILCIAIVVYLHSTRPERPKDGPWAELVGQTRSDGITTIQIKPLYGNVLSEEIQVEFEAYLGGRGDSAEFVKGKITALDNNPSISWDNAPTVTEVSIANVPGDIGYGEIWELSFQVSAASYFVDVTRLEMVHVPSGLSIFSVPVPPPS